MHHQLLGPSRQGHARQRKLNFEHRGSLAHISQFTIIEGLMTTVHSTTATQKTVDGPSNSEQKSILSFDGGTDIVCRGLARRSNFCYQHHPFVHRGRQGELPRSVSLYGAHPCIGRRKSHSLAQRQAHRNVVPSPHYRRLGRGPCRPNREAGAIRRDRRCHEEGCQRRDEGYPRVCHLHHRSWFVLMSWPV